MGKKSQVDLLERILGGGGEVDEKEARKGIEEDDVDGDEDEDEHVDMD